MRFLFSPNLKKAEKQFGDTSATRGENRQEELLHRASELVGAGEGSSDEEKSDNERLDEKTITPRGGSFNFGVHDEDDDDDGLILKQRNVDVEELIGDDEVTCLPTVPIFDFQSLKNQNNRVSSGRFS